MVKFLSSCYGTGGRLGFYNVLKNADLNLYKNSNDIHFVLKVFLRCRVVIIIITFYILLKIIWF